MPNDPRLKFKKKVYDMSRNPYYTYFGDDSSFRPGGGSGAGGGGEPVIPPDPGGGGEPWTPLNPSIPVNPPPEPTPEPDNPNLNPGQIAGIAIGSIAAAAALGYAAKKAADEMERRRLGRNRIPSTTDGIELDNIRRPTLPKGISKAIKAGFTSLDSSPASSQSSSRSSSGTTTPANRRGVPTPFEQAGFSAGIDLLNPRPSGPVPKILPPSVINPDAVASAAEQLAYQTEMERVRNEMAQARESINILNPRKQPSSSTSGSSASTPERVDLETQLEYFEGIIETDKSLTRDEIEFYEALAKDTKIKLKALEKAKTAATLKEAAVQLELQKTEALKAAALQATQTRVTKLKQLQEQINNETENLKFINEELAKPRTPAEVKILKQQRLAVDKKLSKLVAEANKITTSAEKSVIRAGARPIPRDTNVRPPTGNTPTTDALNASRRSVNIGENTRMLGSIQDAPMVEVDLDFRPPQESMLERTRRMFGGQRAQVEPVSTTELGDLRPQRNTAVSQEQVTELDAAVRASEQELGTRAPSRAPIKLKDFLAKLGLSELMPILQTEGFDSVHAIGNYDINEANEMREALINRGVPENDINRILEEAKGAPFGAETEPRQTYEDRGIIKRRPEILEREAAGVGIDFNATQRPAPAPAPADLIDLTERPSPAPRPPPEPMGEELGSLAAQNHIANFNEWYNEFMTKDLYAQGFVDPEIPPDIAAQGELATKKYILDEAINFVTEEGRQGILEQKVVRGQRVETGRKIPRAKMLQSVDKFYQKAIAQEASLPRPSQVERPARAPSADLIDLTERPAPAPAEIQTSRAARPTGIRPPTPPKPRPPAGSAPPSAPGSAPGSEIQTPREGVIKQQTPAERAAFAEELTGRLKKMPGKQKMKYNFGKTEPTSRNPLDIFVSPEHRNMPNTEIHPSSKAFKGTLTEISARVPRLTPIRSNLISVSSNAGGMVGGLAAGYFAGKAMADWFAQHPAKNYNEQYGQALATSFVGMAAGTLAQQVVSAVIRAGVSYVAIGYVEGITSGLSIGPAGIIEGLGEAAVYTLASVTAQMETQRYLENAGYDHAHARMGGSLAATGAATSVNIASWIAHGGPVNPYADISVLVNEIFILGFGIYSMITEHYAGEAQDDEEEAIRQANIEDKRRYDALVAEQQSKLDRALAINEARKNYVLALRSYDYDFDKTLATFSEEDKRLLGVYDKKGDVEAGLSFEEFRDSLQKEFDPFATSRAESTGDAPPPAVLPRNDQLKRDTYMEYVTWYANNLMNIPQKPFDFDSEGAKLLDAETGGSWTSTANVHAATAVSSASYKQPLINNAQQQIMDAYHNDRKPIEQMDPEVLRYADLDSSFRERYETYIVMDSQARILLEFNNTQHTYHDMDPELVAIASRDPNFFGYADEYYRVLTNQARDVGLSISEVARLNALDANNQAIEIGKLNEARNKLIQQQQALNQPIIDSYNANILREISIYGDNFEAIIRNINDQALLTGHNFLYASNRADLYRQLHLEMPEIDIIEPEIDPNQPDATFQPAKGRQIGDTILYNYRYHLTDAQNKELDEDAVKGKYLRDSEAMERNARRIYERDRYLFEETDAEKAAALDLTLEEYYAKFNITPPLDEIKEWTPETSKGGVPDGRYRRADGCIETYRNNILVHTDTSQLVTNEPIKYDPTLAKQPDGLILMPDTSVREYKDGLVVRVEYNNTSGYGLTPDEINKAEAQTTPQTLFSGERSMPDGTTRTYSNGKIIRVNFPPNVTGAMIKANDVKQLNRTEGLYYGEPTTTPVTPPITPPTETREPTYEELKIMYKTDYENKQRFQPETTIEADLREMYKTEPVPLPTPTTTPAPTPTPQTTASSLNLAVAPSAPAQAPATTSMPEDTTPGIANP